MQYFVIRTISVIASEQRGSQGGIEPLPYLASTSAIDIASLLHTTARPCLQIEIQKCRHVGEESGSRSEGEGMIKSKTKIGDFQFCSV